MFVTNLEHASCLISDQHSDCVDIYYTSFPNDRVSIKALVWCLFFADCFATVCSIHAAWRSLAAGWGWHLEASGSKPVWTFSALLPLCGLGELVCVTCIFNTYNLPSCYDCAIILLLEDIGFRKDQGDPPHHRHGKSISH